MTTATPPRLWIPGGRQLTVSFTVGGQDAVVVLGGQGGGAWNDAAGAATWRDAFWNAFRPEICSAVTCTGAVLRTVEGPDGQVIEVGAPTNPVGLNSGAMTLAGAAMVIKWKTAQGGRSGKGRTFVPGVNEGAVSADGRTWGTGHNAGVQTCINNYLGSAPLSAAGLTPAVLSFRRGAAYAITSGSLAPIVGLQRRRMR